MNSTTKLFALGVALTAIVSCGTSRHSNVPVASANDEAIDIGYGSTTKKDKTYASSKVDINNKEISAYTSMYDYLRGRVPGVEVTSSNRIVIRGVSTNSGETDPLILVDGVEVADLSSIDPINVDSVSVLKDASSSIYGSRGGNGVILINMKR